MNMNIEDAKEDLAELFFQCARYERPSTDWISALDKFTAQVAETEREACAKVCDDLEQNGFHFETYDGWDELPAEACHCAAAIRARSNAVADSRPE